MTPSSVANSWTRIAPIRTVPLLFPGIGVVVVAVALPEPGPVGCGELETGQPLRALPEVEVRNNRAYGAAMLDRQRFAVRLVDDERVLLPERGERHVGRVARIGVLD